MRASDWVSRSKKVLQMSVFERTDLHLKLKKINLHDFIHKVVQNFNVQIISRNGKINLFLDAKTLSLRLMEYISPM